MLKTLARSPIDDVSSHQLRHVDAFVQELRDLEGTFTAGCEGKETDVEERGKEAERPDEDEQ